MQPALVQVVERQAARREDLYTGIHKAMRALLCDTLVALGRMDCADEVQAGETLGQVRLAIELGRHHLHHENQHVHPVMESRVRGSTSAAARAHTEHEESFQRLEALVLRVERGRGAAREAAALELYRAFALHVADDLAHMHGEETQGNALLWAHCSDEELKAAHRAILASVGPRLMGEYLRWLAPAMTPSERAALLSEMRQSVPSEEYSGVLQLVRSLIGEREWSKLLGALGPRPLTS
jgi:hypothetical protein